MKRSPAPTSCRRSTILRRRRRERGGSIRCTGWRNGGATRCGPEDRILGYWPWVVAQFELKDDGAKSKGEKKAEKLADAEEKEVEQLEAEDPGNQGS